MQLSIVDSFQTFSLLSFILSSQVFCFTFISFTQFLFCFLAFFHFWLSILFVSLFIFFRVHTFVSLPSNHLSLCFIYARIFCLLLLSFHPHFHLPFKLTHFSSPNHSSSCFPLSLHLFLPSLWPVFIVFFIPLCLLLSSHCHCCFPCKYT